VALIGPNGCGKTTLLKAITKLVPSKAGSVHIRGEPVEALTSQEMARRVAVVSQGAQLPVGYTVREIVLMGRTAHLGFLQQEGRADFTKVDEVLTLVGAEHLADRLVDELSGGERQNAVIARALAQEAPLLLLDEPTANLDLGHQIAVAQLMRRLTRERGLAVLAAIHDLTLASLYADRLVLMRDGTILASGKAAAVLTPKNIRAAYGVDAMLAPVEGLDAPVVLPFDRISRDIL
jgi:iron complex transport system ATP-binding protein